MHSEIVPLVVGLIILFSSLISLRLGISVAIIEVVIGAVFGNIGLETTEWMSYLASFGGILLTFLAGTEIDMDLLRKKFKASFLIGFFSFILPFIGVSIFTYFVLDWNYHASLIAGTALSTTSLAVVYSVLVESNLSKTDLGKLLMAATFITDIGVALALSILFIKPTLYTLVFIFASTVVIYFAYRFSIYFLNHPKYKNKVVESEIKYFFALLLTLMYFAKIGDGQAVLPAFILGLFLSKHFKETSETKILRNRLRTVAYAIITPLFFIVSGLKISAPMIYGALGIFIILFIIKIITKFIGVYFISTRFIGKGQGRIYLTLLMSTGLTFGTISSMFGLSSGIINLEQYSVLVGVVIASAVIPTFIAQKWFMPIYEEDIIDS